MDELMKENPSPAIDSTFWNTIPSQQNAETLSLLCPRWSFCSKLRPWFQPFEIEGTMSKMTETPQDFSFWNLLILYLLGLITLKTGNSSLLRLPKILAYTVIKSPRDHPSLPEANTFWLCNWRGSPWELDTGQKLLNLTAVLTVLDRCFSHSKNKKIPTLKYT